MKGGISLLRIRAAAAAVLLCVVAVLLSLGMIGRVDALQLQSRSLTVGDVTAGAVTRHTFKFSYRATGVPVGSLMFEYCKSPLIEVACEAPDGMNASSAVLTQQVGEGGYFVLTAQTNRIILTRAPSLPPTVNPSSYVFDNIQNPTGSVGTFYVRITTHGSTDATGNYIDFGSVVNSTTQGVQVSGEVPPYLKFCVGVVITGDCATAEGNLVDLGTLTTSQVSSGSSQMMVATNADFGLVIGMYGTTLTSGNNIIPALANPTVSAPGNAQFGINLRDNSNPDVGEDPNGEGIVAPAPKYNIPNRYAFESGDTVAVSDDATDTRKLTVSYIANIPPGQAPGVYTATLTYICTATF
ncbi:MAG TPA: hypothetical protein VFT16_04645 [Candidatus Saccharimonadales bacterium]|nr:hypothetical protein [Candidatus Saccharimonadales bacterium]